MLFRHTKSGGVYRLLHLALQEDNLEPLVVYQLRDSDQVWVRPASEFFDGRFQVVTERNGSAPALGGMTR